MPNKDFVRRGDFLAGMFCVQAFTVGAAFLVLGWTAALIAAVSDPSGLKIAIAESI